MSQFLDHRLSRREWLKMSAAGVAVGSTSGWLEAMAADTAASKERKGSCILLWMTGGPSQTDTFDMKPDHANGGEFKPIETSVPGINISEHLPNLAKQMQHMVPIRSMQSKEGDHERATFYLRTGYRPQGPVHYPTLGSLISNELGDTQSELPNFVSISPFRVFSPGAYSPGFLGPQYAPVVIGEYRFGQQNAAEYEKSLKVENMQRPSHVEAAQADARLSLLSEMETSFGNARPGLIAQSHQTAYQQAVRMMRSDAVKAFELDEEPAKLRDEYGRNQFGQSCLLARRLVERGVPFVEVSLNSVDGRQFFGWDTHGDNFNQVKALSGVLDPGWGTLLKDLKDRGLLETTTIVWMGEFGRTPNINGSKGRDHFPAAWSTVVCGGGIKGGQVVGKTNESGMSVADRPVSVPDLLATVVKSLGIDPNKQNMSNVGRPIRIADPEGKPIEEILA
jgi:hypothetical protein